MSVKSLNISTFSCIVAASKRLLKLLLFLTVLSPYKGGTFVSEAIVSAPQFAISANATEKSVYTYLSICGGDSFVTISSCGSCYGEPIVQLRNLGDSSGALVPNSQQSRCGSCSFLEVFLRLSRGSTTCGSFALVQSCRNTSESGSCGGIYSIQGASTSVSLLPFFRCPSYFIRSATASATINTVNCRFAASAGESVILLYTFNIETNVMFRLRDEFDPRSVDLAVSQDNSNVGSILATYRVPNTIQGARVYTVRQGCFGDIVECGGSLMIVRGFPSVPSSQPSRQPSIQPTSSPSIPTSQVH